MKKQSIAIFMCLFGLLSFAHAQEKDTVRVLKNDFGFNTNLILQNIINSGSAPFSVMYKHYTKPDKALRIGLTASFSNNNTSGSVPPGGGYSDFNSVNVSAIIGKEKQKYLSGKWGYYYGGDIVLSYNSTTNDFYRSDVNGNNIISKVQSSDFKGYNAALRPFLGIRFNINRRVYLATEASLKLAFGSNATKQNDFTNNVKTDTKTSSSSFDLSPSSGIFLFYRF